MEEFQRSFSSAISLAQDSNLGSTILSSFDKVKSSVNSSLSSSSPSTTPNYVPTEIPPHLLVRSSGRMVSLLTCSKLCAVCFFAGVFAGYTLKRRVRHWASRLLKRLKDD